MAILEADGREDLSWADLMGARASSRNDEFEKTPRINEIRERCEMRPF